MITGFYGALLALLYMRLTMGVVKQRRHHRVSLGDGGVDALQQAVSAHNNAGQYIPLFLVLLLVLELQQLHWALLHLAGIAFLTGRLLHADSIVKTRHKMRVRGMQLTLFTIIGLAAANILTYGRQLLLVFQ